IQEAALSGRLAAEAVAAGRRGRRGSPAERYQRTLKAILYGRLRHRHKLMGFLERHPLRFDLLFEQLARAPRLADLLQRERNDFTPAEWLYLYGQAASFSLRVLRA
ncbi:MAG: hypothetical protein ACREM8_00810, partial [Vulcanimicrobiaceae bacterium]